MPFRVQGCGEMQSSQLFHLLLIRWNKCKLVSIPGMNLINLTDGVDGIQISVRAGNEELNWF